MGSEHSHDALNRLRALVEAETSDGALLAKDIGDNPICSVLLDRSVPCLTVAWRQYATSNQMRFVHESMLGVLSDGGVSKLLGDDTSLPTVHMEDRAWIVDDWMPRAVAAGLKTIAAKKSEGYFGRLSTQSISAQAPKALTIRFFDTIEEARRWLKNFGSENS